MLRGGRTNYGRCGPRRVVIVSDDPLFVETTSLGFRAEGEFTVFHCPPARTQAQAIVRAGRDLVLLDESGTADGTPDLVRELCAQVERPVVLVLSGEPDRLASQPILAAGATAVISKAIGGGALLTLVREMLAGRIVVKQTDVTPAHQRMPGADLVEADGGFDGMRLIVAA